MLVFIISIFVVLPSDSTACYECELGPYLRAFLHLCAFNFIWANIYTILYTCTAYTANEPTAANLHTAIEQSFKEGNAQLLTTLIHWADVFKSTKPENISCGQEGGQKIIVCSVFNLDVTFNVRTLVRWCILAEFLGFQNRGSTRVGGWACLLLWPVCGGPRRPWQPQNED